MNQKTEAIIHLIMAMVIIALLSIAAYYIGVAIEKSYIVGYLADKGEDLTLSEWEDLYLKLVLWTGIAVSILLLLWTILTHFVFSIHKANDANRRLPWVIFWIITSAACIAIPYFFVYYEKCVKIFDAKTLVLFFVLYCIIGFWGGSIFVTAHQFKYTPPLAGLFRR